MKTDVLPAIGLSMPFNSRKARPVRAASDVGRGPALARHKILIVEDNPLLAMNTEDYLTEAGYDVVGIASTGEMAIELVARHRPALAVMDIRLAGTTDGIAAAVAIFDLYGTRSIFASAHDAPEMRERAAIARPAGWITKPYAMAELVRAIAAALSPSAN
jgi:DNA-binding NarL/FixJ family response regulator